MILLYDRAILTATELKQLSRLQPGVDLTDISGKEGDLLQRHRHYVVHNT